MATTLTQKPLSYIHQLVSGESEMRAKIEKIGDNHYIRLPKSFLENFDVTDEVELEIETARIKIRPTSNPRAGWDKAFRIMAETGDDAMLEDVNGPV